MEARQDDYDVMRGCAPTIAYIEMTDGTRPEVRHFYSQAAFEAWLSTMPDLKLWRVEHRHPDDPPAN